MVSFVVPCFKLAHLLPECIRSILRQSFSDFEVLIMDDASPDETPSVARCFGDLRVKHVRNEQNLGHLRNYNKGIQLSQGKYIWLISADDYLESPHVLKRYVDCLNRHPCVGFAFCSGYSVWDGMKTGIMGRYRTRRDRDQIISGHEMLKKLLPGNFVLAPSGMVRRECYEQLGNFPLHLPFAGDWYLWCQFALHWDVAYFSEPMVCYHDHHPLSMTSILLAEKLDECGTEEIGIAWDIVRKARQAGYVRLANELLPAVAQSYARTLARERYRHCASFMNFKRLGESLDKHISDEVERRRFLAWVHEAVGNECYWQGRQDLAKKFYGAASREFPLALNIHLKRLLLSLGWLGNAARAMLVPTH